MGRMIAPRTATPKIIKDLEDTVTNSGAAGGKIAELAQLKVVPVALMIREVEADIAAAKKVSGPLVATVEIARGRAIDVLNLVYDLTWNQVGRPASDTSLSQLFPGGAGHYIEGESDQLPDRIELLAQLFEKGIHPKLSKEQNEESAAKLRAGATVHSDAVSAARIPVAKVVLLERTRTTLARSAHSALSNFKRLLKVAGFTEAQIHEIIPSHPTGAPKKAPAKGNAAKEPVQGRPAEAKPAEAKPVEAKPVEGKPAEVKPTEAIQSTG